jgi:type IV secretory pathway VirB10-like protein
VADDKIRLGEGPQIAKSNKGTKRYGKRIILVFILGVGALLFLITAQAQFKRAGQSQQDQEKNYRAPQPSGFAELAAGMRRDRRPVVQEVTQVVIASEEVKQPPRQQAQRVVIKTAERKAEPPRYYSNQKDAQAATTLHTLKLQALASRPVVEDFVPEKDKETDTATQAGGPASLTGPGGGAPSVMSAADMASAAAALMQQTQQPDQNRQAQKMDFLRGGNGGGSMTAQGYSENLPTPQQFPYELKAGTIIPGIMLSGINSDLPGNVIGQVSENVWDTSTGRYVLIPKGTRILGVYDSQVTFGQRRVLLVWNRLIFPNGMSLNIAGSPGVDQAGYSGLSGRVNEHWDVMLKSALLASVFVAGAEIVYDSDKDQGAGGGSQNKSPGDVAAESAAGAIINMGTRLADRAMNIQPTITIRPGKRMGIFVQQDVVFPFPYF